MCAPLSRATSSASSSALPKPTAGSGVRPYHSPSTCGTGSLETYSVSLHGDSLITIAVVWLALVVAAYAWLRPATSRYSARVPYRDLGLLDAQELREQANTLDPPALWGLYYRQTTRAFRSLVTPFDDGELEQLRQAVLTRLLAVVFATSLGWLPGVAISWIVG